MWTHITRLGVISTYSILDIWKPKLAIDRSCKRYKLFAINCYKYTCDSLLLKKNTTQTISIRPSKFESITKSHYPHFCVCPTRFNSPSLTGNITKQPTLKLQLRPFAAHRFFCIICTFLSNGDNVYILYIYMHLPALLVLRWLPTTI